MSTARRVQTWFGRGFLIFAAVELDGASRSSDLSRLTRVVARLRSLAPRMRYDPALYGQALFLLATALHVEYEITEDRDRLAESAVLFREASDYPKENPDGFAALHADALVSVYEAFDDAVALDEALRLIRAVRPDADALQTLAKALIRYADHIGDRAALDEAIDVLRRVREEYGAEAHLLGLALCRRAELTGDDAELREGINALESIAWSGSTPAAHAARGNLATVLVRATRATDPEARESAWRIVTELAERAEPGTELRRVIDYAALSLGASPYARSGGDRAGLNEDVAIARSKLETLAPGHVLRPHLQFVLADALEIRYRAQGGLRDLEEAAELLQQTLAAALRYEDWFSIMFLDEYAAVASEIFRVTGDPRTLTDAVERLADARMADDEEAEFVRSTLAVLRIQLAIAGGDHDKIAALLATTPAARLPEDGPIESTSWHRALRLVRARLVAARRIGAVEVFSDAVATLERLYQGIEPTDPERPSVAVDLAQSTILAAAFDRVARGSTRRGTGLTRQQLADRLRAEWTEWSERGEGERWLSPTLAELVRELVADPDDAAGAAALARAAQVAASGAEQLNARVPDRLTAALRWAATEHNAGQPAAALPGYELAIGLLDQLAWRGLSAVERERLLAEHDHIARQAAACAVAAGRPERAIELLEQGRATLLQQSLDTRGHDPLATAYPALAARLTELDDRIAAPPAAIGSSGTDAERARADAEARMEAALAREELITQIRTLPGLADFLAPPRLAALRPPHGSAVVVVNTTDLGSHALIVTGTDVRVVPLAADFHDDALLAVEDLFAGLDARETDPDSAAAALQRVLSWLNAHLCEPVRAALPADITRLWWCPTGPAVLLPLHAAPPPESPLDAIPTSYAPTLRLLRQHREHPPPASGSVLAVTPTSAGDDALPAAHRIPAALAASLRVTRLDGTDATADALLARLAGHVWLHFAGHGSQDPGSPFDARLQLTDRAVTARDLAAHRADGAELAMVPACETARTGARLADQAATLTSALQAAGFRHAIGSLWPVPDLIAGKMSELFYAALRSPPPDASDAGRALHEAVHELRTRYGPFDPYAWAAFVHSGP